MILKVNIIIVHNLPLSVLTGDERKETQISFKRNNVGVLEIESLRTSLAFKIERKIGNKLQLLKTKSREDMHTRMKD